MGKMEFRDVTSGGSSGQLSSVGSGGDGVTLRDGGGTAGGGMHHSVSTPAGVDGAARSTPPTTPKKGGKMLAIRVQMLDDTITIFQVQAKALGKVLFEQVCKQLHLLEADYFGLDYQDISGIRYWLDLQKPISRQLGLSLVDPLLFFCVKFYTPDPGQLEEEYTRYLFCLQVKRDLAQGLMQCNDNTASIMASYIVQAECGDYVMEDYPDHTYLSSYKFVPHQDREMEQRIMENHKKHAGQSPAEADLNLLETARRCELYGVKMHTTKDHENVLLNLAVAHMGIVVFQQYTKINTFSWAKIRKISFKRKRFLIKLHPEGFGYYKDTVEFFFEGRNECKNFWKKCVENHGFFRCAAVKNASRHKTRVLSRGSSFRYSGKTQKQVVEFVRDNYVKRQTFQRSASFRHSSAHSSANNMHNTSSVGNSFSAHPLLPLVDNKSCAEAFKPSAPLDTGTGNASMSASKSGTDTRAQPAAETTRPDSPTTRSVCRPPAIPTSWNADRMDRISNSSQPTSTSYPTSAAPIQTMSSPSPPLTMQSVSPITSTTTSPQHQLPASLWTSHPTPANLPEDDHAAARKDDSETTDNCSSLASNNNYRNNNASPNKILTNADITRVSYTNNSNYNKSTPKSDEEIIMNTINANNVTNSNNAIAVIEEDYDAKRNLKYIHDEIFYISKEILMTEITYKKDLDIINVWFRNEVCREEPEECMLLLNMTASLSKAHGLLIRDLELRLQNWENRKGFKTGHGKIADILLTHLPPLLPVYEEYLDSHLVMLERLDVAFKQNNNFEQLYRDFEVKKVCYLPITTLVLKPLHRLLQYQFLLQKLLSCYGTNHPDTVDCRTACESISELMQPVHETLRHSENLAMLCELQHDINGFNDLVQSGRSFIRHGCLLKHSGKGYQQRMFFLFSDILLYTSRCQVSLKFKLHGHMPLRGVLVDEPEGELAKCGLNIYGGSRTLTVAANSPQEMERWRLDLQQAIQEARDKADAKVSYLSLKSCSSSDEFINSYNKETQVDSKPSIRSNAAVHVCWHRSISIGINDILINIQNQLSGYLLRKYKSSNGWQKLWVVFTSFCLFFYKSCADDFPLASLPLLGYTVGIPTVDDCIAKNFVFKLEYKNHVYFFRAESEYTHRRWMEAIRGAVQGSSLENNMNADNISRLS